MKSGRVTPSTCPSKSFSFMNFSLCLSESYYCVMAQVHARQTVLPTHVSIVNKWRRHNQSRNGPANEHANVMPGTPRCVSSTRDVALKWCLLPLSGVNFVKHIFHNQNFEPAMLQKESTSLYRT